MHLLFFLRCIETTVAILGMTISIADVHNRGKLTYVISASIILACSSFLTIIYVHLGLPITEKIFTPLLVVAMGALTYLNSADKFGVTLFNFLTQLVIYTGVSMFCTMVTRFLAFQPTLMYLIMRAVVFSLIIFVEVKYVRKHFRYIVDVINFEWYIASLAVLFFSFLLISLGIYPTMYYNRPFYDQVAITFAFILMAVVYYVFYIALHNTIQKYELLESQLMMKEKLKFMEKYKKISEVDPLTGIFNRRFFQNEVQCYLTLEQTNALLIMDIDDYKQINDQFGHDIGDKALKALSDAMAISFRSSDLLARLGGDEFIVLLNNIQNNDEQIIQRLEVFKQTLHSTLEDRMLPSFSVSMGIVYTTGENDFTKLYQNADKALYKSKEKGKDCLTFYTEEL